MDDRPATKKDLQELEERLTENMRDLQTEVLPAFYNRARPLEMRVRHVDELQIRLSAVEDRVSELERGRLGKQ